MLGEQEHEVVQGGMEASARGTSRVGGTAGLCVRPVQSAFEILFDATPTATLLSCEGEDDTGCSAT